MHNIPLLTLYWSPQVWIPDASLPSARWHQYIWTISASAGSAALTWTFLNTPQVSQQCPCHFVSLPHSLVSWCLWPCRHSLSVLSSVSRSQGDLDSFLLLASHLGWWIWVIVPCLITVQGVHSASQVLCVPHAFAFIHSGAFRLQKYNSYTHPSISA